MAGAFFLLRWLFPAIVGFRRLQQRHDLPALAVEEAFFVHLQHASAGLE